jgi:hypothetical protein
MTKNYSLALQTSICMVDAPKKVFLALVENNILHFKIFQKYFPNCFYMGKKLFWDRGWGKEFSWDS